jgi:hypothetical protein
MRPQRSRFTVSNGAQPSPSQIGFLVLGAELRGLKRHPHYPQPGDRLWTCRPSRGFTDDGRHLGHCSGLDPSRGRVRRNPDGRISKPCWYLPNEALTPLRYDGLASDAGNGARVMAGSSIRRHNELATRGVRAERGGAKLSARAIATRGVESNKAEIAEDTTPGP